MTLEELTRIYPNGYFSETPKSSYSHIELNIEEGWFYIPSKNLSKTELMLLDSLYQYATKKHVSSKHPWYNYLFNELPFPKLTHTYRFIHIHFKKESTLHNEWLTHFSALFNDIEDAFFINATHAILVERQSTFSYEKNDIEAMLMTLEAEFLIQAYIYVGTFYSATPQLINIYYEEERLFHSYRSRSRKVISFQDIALNYLTKNTITESIIMQTFKSTITFDDELKQIIKVLWKEQGNMTSTSKILYVHRNTLQYRLDRFTERTGLSLKNMDELTLCYLLVI